MWEAIWFRVIVAVVFAAVGFFIYCKQRQLRPWFALADELGWERIGTHRLDFTATERGGRVLASLQSRSGRRRAAERLFLDEAFAVSAHPVRGPAAGLNEPAPDDPSALALLDADTRAALAEARAQGVTVGPDGSLDLALGRSVMDDTTERIHALLDLAARLNVPDDVPGRLVELATTDADADHARRCALAAMRHHGDDPRVVTHARTHVTAADPALRAAAGLVLGDVDTIRAAVTADVPTWLRAACGAWLAARFGAQTSGRLTAVAPDEAGALTYPEPA